jgi:hypothetical protein
MSLENITVQEAVRNLEQMKRAIGRVEKTKFKNRLFASNKIGLLLQSGAVLLATPFLFAEWNSAQVTSEILYSAKNTAFRDGGLISLAAFLLSLVAILYLILWDGARKSNEQLGDYVSRNFLALSFLSLLSDLFVKFVAFSLLVMAARPEWVAPLLLVFIADYLIQGRLFTLPFVLNIVAALGCIGIAAYQFTILSASLLPALSVFTALSLSSVIFTALSIRKEEV